MASVAELGIRGTAISILLALIVYLVVNGKLLSQYGQTVGKKLLKIKIVRTDGSPVDLKRIVLYRYLPAQLILLVPVIGNFLSLINVLFVFRSSRQCIHDQIADTKVINAR
ncbi:MAG: RDD family protein [Burkholderiaceae bacterium]|nr:RDD family protein [Burkholderiaceae bacterium]